MTMAAAAAPDKPASRTLVVCGFILATIFSGLVTLWVGTYSATHQARLADRTAQVNRFIESAEAFDPLVVAFVAEAKSGAISPATRKAIKANLVKQRSTLESAHGLLSSNDQALAKEYVEKLVAADAGLKKATGPLDSRAFAQAAVDLATIRPKLYDAIRAN